MFCHPPIYCLSLVARCCAAALILGATGQLGSSFQAGIREQLLLMWVPASVAEYIILVTGLKLGLVICLCCLDCISTKSDD